MTNEQNAKRLEEIAACPLCMESGDAPLLSEAAALMRERHPEDALWELEYQRKYKRFELCVGENFAGQWEWSATYGGLQDQSGTAPSLADAQAAAIQWVDSQEKDNGK